MLPEQLPKVLLEQLSTRPPAELQAEVQAKAAVTVVPKP